MCVYVCVCLSLCVYLAACVCVSVCMCAQMNVCMMHVWPCMQVPHLPAALKDLGEDGGWPRPTTCAARPGQDFFRYMRSALTAVGLINKASHHTGYPPRIHTPAAAAAATSLLLAVSLGTWCWRMLALFSELNLGMPSSH